MRDRRVSIFMRRQGYISAAMPSGLDATLLSRYFWAFVASRLVYPAAYVPFASMRHASAYNIHFAASCASEYSLFLRLMPSASLRRSYKDRQRAAWVPMASAQRRHDAFLRASGWHRHPHALFRHDDAARADGRAPRRPALMSRQLSSRRQIAIFATSAAAASSRTLFYRLAPDLAEALFTARCLRQTLAAAVLAPKIFASRLKCHRHAAKTEPLRATGLDAPGRT